MTITMLKDTGRLSLEIINLLEKEKKTTNWIKKLERGSQVAQLFAAIVYVPNWQNYPTFRKLKDQAENKIKKLRTEGDLPRYADQIYTLAKKHLNQGDASFKGQGSDDLPPFQSDGDGVPSSLPPANTPPEIRNTEGIPNLSANCWLCGTLQLLRSTHYFDSIIAEGPANEEANLKALRTHLQEVIRRLRANEGLDRLHISTLLLQLHKAKFIGEMFVQRDPEEILIRLAAELGHIDTMTISHHFNYFDGGRNNFWVQEVAQENLQTITLEVRKPNLTTQQLISNNFFSYAGNVLEAKVHFIVRDAQGAQLANYDNAFCRNEAKTALERQNIFDPPEELIHAFQKAEILHRHGGATVEVVPLFQHIRRVQHYPPFVEVLLNKFGGDHQIQVSLDVALSNPLQEGIVEQPVALQAHPYTLKSVICRRGVALNGAPGHIWYLLRDREHNSWKRYDDTECTDMTNEQALQELSKHAYACFYEVLPQQNQQVIAQPPQNSQSTSLAISTSTATVPTTSAKK
jgi:hypothetical protein